MAESNLKGHGEKTCIVEGGQSRRVFASAVGIRDSTQIGWITARSGFVEFTIECRGDEFIILAKDRATSKSESESISASPAGIDPIGFEADIVKLEFGFEFEGEFIPQEVLDSRCFSCGRLGDSRKTLISYRDQTHRSLLPGCQKFQEVIEVFKTVSIPNNVHHSRRQVREDGFQ